MPTDLVEAFIDAFNAEDLDALEMVVDPDVVLIGARGRVVGSQAVRKWAVRKPTGDLHQHLTLEEVEELGPPSNSLVAKVLRQWLWKGTSEVADQSHLRVTVMTRGNLIAHWEIEEV